MFVAKTLPYFGFDMGPGYSTLDYSSLDIGEHTDLLFFAFLCVLCIVWGVILCVVPESPKNKIEHDRPDEIQTGPYEHID